MDRRGDKVLEIEKYLEELKSVIPESFEEYRVDFVKKAACERYFEKITEALVDLAFIIIKEGDLDSPDEEKKSFEVLADSEIISRELCLKLQDAKGMRNIIAHEYGGIDDCLVFKAVKSELSLATFEFLEAVK